MLVTLLTAAVMAAPTNDVWVVVTSRSGVPAPRALETARAVSAALVKANVPSATPVEDLSSCKGKKPCLVAKGKAKGVPAMVLVEVGVVLGDGVGQVEAVSVEEFGKKLAGAQVEGPGDALSGLLVEKTSMLVEPLKDLLGLKAAPVVTKPIDPPKPVEVVKPVEPPPPAPPVVVAEVFPPPPLPANEVVAPVEPSTPAFLTLPRIIGLAAAGVGLIGVVLGSVFLGEAASASRAIDAACGATRDPCASLTANQAYARGYQAQSVGLPMLIGGGAVAIAGAVLFLLNPQPAAPSTPAVSFMLLPGGAGASVEVSLP
ncbi:MAG: hypothetical protein Q8S33_15495 [Myxococcales bacterium]|nr:hypothetical protein [Myxococcales bacterium]MDP3501741.1 hypothetical protein [Myxococcales bacterium]